MDRPKLRVNNTETKKEKNSPQNSHNNQEPSQNYRKYKFHYMFLYTLTSELHERTASNIYKLTPLPIRFPTTHTSNGHLFSFIHAYNLHSITSSTESV